MSLSCFPGLHIKSLASAVKINMSMRSGVRLHRSKPLLTSRQALSHEMKKPHVLDRGLPASGIEVSGALLPRGPMSHPDALPLLPGAAAVLVQLAPPGAAEGTSQPDGALLPEGASQREARLESSDEGWRGVAMTGTHALSRIGVAEPVQHHVISHQEE